MKHYGTYKCGHEGILIVDYTNRHRYNTQEKIDKYFEENLCRECFLEKREAERRAASEKALEEAKELGLAELIGTEKQVRWATVIRKELIESWERRLEPNSKVYVDPYRFLNNFESYIGGWEGIEGKIILEEIRAFRKMNKEEYVEAYKQVRIKPNASREEKRKVIKMRKESEERELLFVKDLVFGALATCNKASAFIDIKTRGDFEDFFKIIYNRYKAIREEKQYDKEDTVIVPVELQDDRIVNIYSKGKVLCCECYLDTDVKDICADNHYEKEDSVYFRVINEEMHGTMEDRKIEIANKILNAGYSVRVDDSELRNKIINAEYEPEHRRWIGLYEGKLVAIFDFEKDREIKNEIKVIKGMELNRKLKWVLIPVEKHLEVQDIAEKFDFKYTERAKKEIEKIKETLENSIESVEKSLAEKEYNNRKTIDEVYTDLLDGE